MLGFRVQDENGYAVGDEYRATVPPGMGHGGSGGSMLLEHQNFTFNMEVPESEYTVEAVPATIRAGRKQEVGFTIVDQDGNPVTLSSEHPTPLNVTFINTDGTAHINTYPGNTDFGTNEVAPVHDHGPNADPNHSHSQLPLMFVNVAHADGGHDHGAGVNLPDGTYTVPVKFLKDGQYRAFVQFVPEGMSEPVLVSFDMQVAEKQISIDNFNWSKEQKWWTLLIISLVLMTLLSMWVRKYLNVEKDLAKKPTEDVKE